MSGSFSPARCRPIPWISSSRCRRGSKRGRGGSWTIFHGDPAAEAFLSEWIGAQPTLGLRNMNMESLYEYGSRAGFWRLHRAFTARNVPVTVYAVAMALERNPAAVAGMLEAGWEIATHGYRWID